MPTGCASGCGREHAVPYADLFRGRRRTVRALQKHGESVGTSGFSILIDATLGDYKQTLR